MRRIEAAEEHRAKVGLLLQELHAGEVNGGFTVIDPDADHAERVAQTLAACEAGSGWIWQAALPTDREHGRRGHAELLVRVDSGYLPIIVVNHRISNPAKSGGAKNGGENTRKAAFTSPLWGWHPANDITRTAKPPRRDIRRLAHLTMMLRDLGVGAGRNGADPELLGGIIGLDADCIVVCRSGDELADYTELFDRRRLIAGQIITTEPRRIGECRGCQWWSRCEPELRERHDVSLVAPGDRGLMLVDIGITTVDQLAAYTGPPPLTWPGSSPFGDTVATAAAWLAGVPAVRRREQPTVARADIEVDVDMESYGERGAYLWGTLLTDRTDPAREVVYRPFVTWDPLPSDDEARSFAEFWAWLGAEREAARQAGKTFAAYCYSEQAENRWLRGSAQRFAGSPGIPTAKEVESFIASPEWVDIFAAVSDNFICPEGRGLKVIAPLAGFHWQDAEAGGEASMEWYRAAVGLEGTPLDESQRARLLQYNADDVWATKVLREWIDDGAAEQLPLVDEVLAPYRSGPSAG